ncbi:O-antigen ligase family protein [Rhodopirellula sallentina]|nr:O-antigen ligase family protein [Rhodopirellula sallentina]
MPSYFPYQTMITVCTLIGLGLGGFPGFKLRISLMSPMFGMIAFIALAFMSSLSTIGPDLTAFYMRYLWKIILMACLAMGLIDTPKKMLVLLMAICVAQGYNSLQINVQYFQDGFSAYSRNGWAFGMRGDNNIYSSATIPMLSGSLALGLLLQRTWQRVLFLSIAVLATHQIMLLESRGAMLGAIAAFGVLVLMVRKTTYINTVFACGLIVGALLAGPPVVKEFASAFESRDNLDGSAASRFVVWKAGLEITRDYPLLGVGPWCGSMLVPSYADLPNSRKELHNIFLEISTGCGLLAAFAYFGSFWLAWYRSLRTRPLLYRFSTVPDDQSALEIVRLSVIAGLAGYFVASMFSAAALSESSYVFLALGSCMSTYVRQFSNSCEKQDEPNVDSLAQEDAVVFPAMSISN